MAGAVDRSRRLIGVRLWRLISTLNFLHIHIYPHSDVCTLSSIGRMRAGAASSGTRPSAIHHSRQHNSR